MKKGKMNASRPSLTIFFSVALFLSAACAVAQQNQTAPTSAETVTDIPLIQEDSSLVVSGQTLVLWGVKTLAPDQQCWQGDVAWGCGEQALLSLRHYLDGHRVTCTIKQPATTDKPAQALCLLYRHHEIVDIAEHLVSHGWALEDPETSSSFYKAPMNNATENGYGIWSGRFQSAEDWRDGIPRFMGKHETGE